MPTAWRSFDISIVDDHRITQPWRSNNPFTSAASQTSAFKRASLAAIICRANLRSIAAVAPNRYSTASVQ